MSKTTRLNWRQVDNNVEPQPRMVAVALGKPTDALERAARKVLASHDLAPLDAATHPPSARSDLEAADFPMQDENASAAHTPPDL